MNLNLHVAAIQQHLARGRSSDDKDYSDRFIAHMLKIYRALLLKRKLDKGQELSTLNQVTLCMPLQESQYADCPGCDVPITGCIFYRSKEKVPSAIISRKRNPYIIRTLDGMVISMMSVLNNKYAKYSGMKNLNKGWFLSDGYLYIIWPINKDTFPIELVLIDFIPEDPDNLEQLNPCGNTTIENPCLQNEDNDYFIDPELIPPLYDMVLERFQRNYVLPQDDLGNARSADAQEDIE